MTDELDQFFILPPGEEDFDKTRNEPSKGFKKLEPEGIEVELLKLLGQL